MKCRIEITKYRNLNELYYEIFRLSNGAKPHKLSTMRGSNVEKGYDIPKTKYYAVINALYLWGMNNNLPETRKRAKELAKSIEWSSNVVNHGGWDRKWIAEFEVDFSIRNTNEDLKETLIALLGEGIHAGFRKATDCPESAKIHKLITQMPNEDWGNVLEFAIDPLMDLIPNR